MALINYPLKEMTIKIVYYGPGLSGKTTSLKYIYDNLPEKNKGKIVTLATEGDRTFFFDFLPITTGKIGSFNTRIQLYTVPGQVFYEKIRRMVLQGTDGVVFVADSQETALDANKESLSSLFRNLKVNNIEVEEIPIVFAYNKRDLPNILPVSTLNRELNENNYPYFETSAITGEGIMETLRKALELTINSVKRRYKFQSDSEREETIIFKEEDISKEIEKEEKSHKHSNEPSSPSKAIPEDDFSSHNEPTINMEDIDEITPIDEYDLELEDSDIEEAEELLKKEEKMEAEKKEENDSGIDETLVSESKNILEEEDEPIPIDKISELAEEFDKEEENLSELFSGEAVPSEEIVLEKEEESSEKLNEEIVLEKEEESSEKLNEDDINVKLSNDISIKKNKLIIPIEIKVKDLIKKIELKLEISSK